MKAIAKLVVLFSVLVVQMAQGWDGNNFKKPSSNELKQRLSKLQFEVTQKAGTERPFKNEYWDNHKDGLYVDVVSGEPLFTSLDKYESGTGWPSFTKPLVGENITLHEDNSLFSKRTEVRSKHADSHLGHVFDDGPKPTGKRYCMNSAAMRFIPVADLEKEGYGEYAKLFQGTATETAIFAGGCFWCMVSPFQKLPGVISIFSGYTGGELKNPTYEQVSAGNSGHIESIEVKFDPKKLSYDKLLEVYWHNIDPLDSKGQFCDKGPQYRSVIFYQSEDQKKAAEASKLSLAKSGTLKGEIATEIIKASPFYPAEDYHQDYHRKNPIRYKYYRTSCGRDKRLKEIWGEKAGH